MSLYNLLAHAWIQLIPNHSEGMLRLLSAIFSIASIPLIYLLGCTLSNDRKRGMIIGLIGAILVASNPFFIAYAQEFRSYSLTFFLTTLSTYLFIKCFSQEDGGLLWKAFYAITASASVYSHFHAVFVIFAHFVAMSAFLFSWEKNREKLTSYFITGIGIFMLCLPILYIAYAKGSGQIGWLKKPTITSLYDFLSNLANGNKFFAISLFFVIIALFFSEGIKQKRSMVVQWRIWLIFGCLLIPVAMVFLLSIYLIPLFHNRYLLITMPYLSLLIAAGLLAFYAELWRFKYLKPVASVLAASMIYFFANHVGIRISNHLERNSKEDWRNASQYLADECSDALRLYYRSYVVKPVYYYHPELRDLNDVLLENLIRTTSNPYEIALKLPKSHTKACVVLSHVPDKSKQKLIQDALYNLYPKATGRKFSGIGILVFTKKN